MSTSMSSMQQPKMTNKVKDKLSKLKSKDRMYLPHTAIKPHMQGGSCATSNIMDSIKTTIAEDAMAQDSMINSHHQQGIGVVTFNNVAVHHLGYWAENYTIDNSGHRHLKDTRSTDVQDYIDAFEAEAATSFAVQQHKICEKKTLDYETWLAKQCTDK